MKWFRKKPRLSSNEKVPPKRSADLQIIRQKFADFYALLEANNLVLYLIGDMEEKSQGDYLFDLNYIRDKLAQVRPLVIEIIDRMVALGGPAYEGLRKRYDLIDTQIDVVLPGNRPLQKDRYIRPFNHLERMHSYSVGSKNAQLGEMKSKLGLPVPPGFAITAWAYKQFIEANNLQERISREISLIDIRSHEDLARVSKAIRELVSSSGVPDDIVAAIKEAAHDLTAHSGTDRFSMRSSAVGEDTLFSFAGQYRSYLNVHSDDLVRYYREVLANKFTPQAIYYFLSHDLSESALAMSVGCVAMVDAVAAGVAYTRCPVNPSDDRIMISSIYGLGKYLVDGTLTPDVFRVSRQDFKVDQEIISDKPVCLVMNPDGGTMEQAVPESLRAKPSLSEEHLCRLARYADQLERHYNSPQDIEWAVDKSGQLLLLQTRPLQVMKAASGDPPPDMTNQIRLTDHGYTVCHGAGAGKVHHVSAAADLFSVPEGAVLVAPHPFPGLITAMGKINALITSVGSVASHMATIAREYRIPTLVGVPDAAHLPAGLEVTVDATGAVVYEGRMEALINARRPQYEQADEGTIYDVLGRILDLISPLRLLYPDDDDFVAENCVTFHDITRFAHQRATEEMFLGAKDLEDKDQISLRLRTEIPLQVNIIYIDREYHLDQNDGWVSPDDIGSTPMEEFWSGVVLEGWPRAAAPKGMKPVGTIAGKEPHPGARLGYSENSFAILGHEYMIVSLRTGYHLATVEALSSEDLSKNYIRMQFSYGGATLDRRKRRVKLITHILRTMGFVCQRRADFLSATMSYKDRHQISHTLHLLGRLTIMTKQLDMALSSDRITEWYAKDFMKQLGLKWHPDEVPDHASNQTTAEAGHQEVGDE
ncbi:MAG: PEP/pyruvate-binding domain-containing protein [bacterium]